MARFLNRNHFHVARRERVHFFACCEGKICAFTKTEHRQFESGVTRVAMVASIVLVIELILLRYW
jgi:hypothetical protein